MSEVVLKRPTKLQREVAKMRYDTAIELQKRKHAAKLIVVREPPSPEIIAQVEAQRLEREAVVKAKEAEAKKIDNQIAWGVAILCFVVSLILMPPM